MGGEERDEIVASFAVAFCEGEVARLGRIWADGQLLDPQGLTYRFYTGSETQLADSLIEAVQGSGAAPAYRGTCYIVFERLPLSRFGNRIPTISVELCRVVGALESAIRAITVIPGSTEFGYDPVPRLRVVAPGETVTENAHLLASTSNWTYSIDEVCDICPNLEHVALVVAWFGDDLRCAACTIGPRVEAYGREILDVEWSVAGLGRDEVPEVSYHDGGPAYGGTPSDASVLAAIADLKARGLKVTLYPFVLMDVPHDNVLPDPYSDAGAQAPYPWRGRITCDPAPGQVGSPDATGAVDAQIDAFLAGGYRALHQHYAEIAVAAGGVDAILIGSEMRGMTTQRGAGNAFPFVAALVGLAAEVRAIVGSDTAISYGADWSEYSGHQPDGEKFFHLDPLWSSPDIDAVGIDNYMPLSDWRDGVVHADASSNVALHDLDYLQANIAGGEGFDWFYANAADRMAGIRTPITDGAHDEPWVWRYKDIVAWWSQAHHDRPGGVRQSEPTGWVPMSKPIWFTELGCGSVDRGPNQPNIFGDPKSSEDGRPYFARGASDALVQRQFLRAHAHYWADPANNPPGMLDTDRIYLWTWDARPYPAFPALDTVWADAANHPNGHWLTGRIGGLARDELFAALAADHGADWACREVAPPFVTGYQLSGPTSLREAVEPLLDISGLRLRADRAGLCAIRARHDGAIAIPLEDFAAVEGPLTSRKRSDAGEAIGRMSLSYLDRERDYQAGAVTALRGDGGSIEGMVSGLTLETGAARLAAETMLGARGSGLEEVEFALPPSFAALEPGDLVDLPAPHDGRFEITEISDGLERRIRGRGLPASGHIVTMERHRARTAPLARTIAVPVVHLAAVPAEPGSTVPAQMIVAAHARPWPGNLAARQEGTGQGLPAVTDRATIGVTAGPLMAAAEAIWDRGAGVEIALFAGHLSDLGDTGALAGTRRMAIETDAGDWEVVGFASAELVGERRYRVSRLLRGCGGTGPAIGPVGIGNRVIVLDDRPERLPVEPSWVGEEFDLRIFGGSGDITGRLHQVGVGLGVVLPLPPAHLRAVRDAPTSDVLISWTRRSRADADGWGPFDAPLDHLPERYRIEIFDGATLMRSAITEAPEFVYAAGMQSEDFGSLPTTFGFAVAQVSTAYGPGHWSQGAFHE
jgi:hypothetical protein